MANKKTSPKQHQSEKPVEVTIKHSSEAMGLLERKWLVALIFSIFFGWMGLDAFYLGKTGKGILKLFTFGLFGILWLIDIIMIATKSVHGIVWKDRDPNKSWLSEYRAVVVVVGIFVLFCIIVGVGSSNNSNCYQNASCKLNTSGVGATITTTSTPGIDQLARDGKFQFTVTSFSCGVSQITDPNDPYSIATPQGQYCLMDLTVKNIANVSQSFEANAQSIYDNSNKEYSYDSNGTITANPYTTTDEFWEFPTVNPGISISGIVAFDIPKTVTPTYAILHDSIASDGVRVNLK
jgi:hypothetical protein